MPGVQEHEVREATGRDRSVFPGRAEEGGGVEGRHPQDAGRSEARLHEELGLLREGTGTGAQVPAALGVTLEPARREVLGPPAPPRMTSR